MDGYLRSTASLCARKITIFLLLATLSQSVVGFVIQEATTKKFFSLIDGHNALVVLTADKDIATRFDLLEVIDSLVEVIIADKDTGLVLDYSGSGPDLIGFKYHGMHNQRFKLNLDVDYNWQIGNGENKWLYYNAVNGGLIGKPFMPNVPVGYIFFEDDAETPFPCRKLPAEKANVAPPPPENNPPDEEEDDSKKDNLNRAVEGSMLWERVKSPMINFPFFGGGSFGVNAGRFEAGAGSLAQARGHMMGSGGFQTQVGSGSRAAAMGHAVAKSHASAAARSHAAASARSHAGASARSHAGASAGSHAGASAGAGAWGRHGG